MNSLERIESIRNAVKSVQFELRKVENKSVVDSIQDELWLILRRVTEFEQEAISQ